jgi:hypothetical protein
VGAQVPPHAADGIVGIVSNAADLPRKLIMLPGKLLEVASHGGNLVLQLNEVWVRCDNAAKGTKFVYFFAERLILLPQLAYLNKNSLKVCLLSFELLAGCGVVVALETLTGGEVF